MQLFITGAYVIFHVRIQRGDRGVRTPPPPEKPQNIGFLGNTGPGPLKNHKAAKPAFNVGPSSARLRNNGVSLAGRLWPAFSAIWILFPLIKKRKKSWTPSGKTFWIRACFSSILVPIRFCKKSKDEQCSSVQMISGLNETCSLLF